MVLLPFINFRFFCFNTILSFGAVGKDLFKKLKQQSFEFITPSNWNKLLIPKTKSMFSCISDTKVYILNLCPCISTIIGIMNKTLMNCQFPTWILCVLDANCSSKWSDLQCKWCDLEMDALLDPVSSNIWHSVPSNNFPIVYPCSDIRNDSSTLV